MVRPEHESVDVLVVGGGNAPYCAAHGAREAGARVLVLEKGRRGEHGGNSFYTAGAFRVVHRGLDDELRGVVDDDVTRERWADTDLAPYTAEECWTDLGNAAATGPADSARVRDDEISGHGSSAALVMDIPGSVVGM